MSSTPKRHLIVIDCQNDFVFDDGTLAATHPGEQGKKGSLCVPGANRDAERLSDFIRQYTDEIDDISVTYDSHHEVDISHPTFWVDSDGNNPDPFTIITVNDVKNGKWRTTRLGWNAKALMYLERLEAKGRYPHCIWPVHCVIGSWGHGLYPDFSDALRHWQRERFAIPNEVTKGSNLFTEHFSAVMAEVSDPDVVGNDESVQFNTDFVDTIVGFDEILISGQALSHCVANTVRDVVAHIDPSLVSKFTLLTDTCSNVPGFESLGDDFVKDMTALGMKVNTTADYFSRTLVGTT